MFHHRRIFKQSTRAGKLSGLDCLMLPIHDPPTNTQPGALSVFTQPLFAHRAKLSQAESDKLSVATSSTGSEDTSFTLSTQLSTQLSPQLDSPSF